LKKKFIFPDAIVGKGLTVGEALKNLPSDDPNDEHWELSPQSKKLITHIPEGGSWKNVPTRYLPERLLRIKRQMKKYHSPNFYRRFSRQEIAGTITAAGTPENSGILHPTENRRYTVREIARIQSFPDKFIFVGGSVSSKYHQIGNAVPPKMAQHMATAIYKQVFEKR
jgi:DNA (cytosine-5)-methyltransferase 1